MQECPRCGFTQPKDRYCANCGLDIELYVPAPKSLLYRLSKNTTLHISLALLIILGLVGSIYFNQKTTIDKQIENAPQSLAQNESHKAKILSATGESPLRNHLPQQSTDLAEKQSGTTPTANTKAATSSKESTALLPKEIVITFAEVSKIILQQLASEGQILNETAQTRSFTNNSPNVIAKLKERDPDFKILPGGQSHTLRVGLSAPFDFSHLTARTNEEVGLTLDISPTSISENLIELNVLGQLNLRSGEGLTIANQEISASYSFSPQKTLILAGVLPRQAVSPEDVSPFAGTPLSILESPNFLHGITEFVIFFQTK